MKTIAAKQILSPRGNGSWFGSNYGMNLYKGCSHGCIYCDSRSDCYRVENFDQVRVKENALTILERELRTKRKKGVVANGAMSDPYNPYEAEHGISRGALELLNQLGYGASVLTKSDLVTRDIDILAQIATHSPVVVKFTITTYDDCLCRKIEPNVASSSRRFQALNQVARAGIMTGILVWPLLPFINDNEENIRALVKAAAENGAAFASPAYGVTLRQNQRLYYYEQLDRLFPGTRQKYVQTFGGSYECRSLDYKQLRKAFEEECKRHGLLYRMADISEAVSRQHRQTQISLFEGGE